MKRRLTMIVELETDIPFGAPCKMEDITEILAETLKKEMKFSEYAEALGTAGEINVRVFPYGLTTSDS